MDHEKEKDQRQPAAADVRQITCPKCEQSMRVRPPLANGGKFPCPTCGATLVITTPVASDAHGKGNIANQVSKNDRVSGTKPGTADTRQRHPALLAGLGVVAGLCLAVIVGLSVFVTMRSLPRDARPEDGTTTSEPASETVASRSVVVDAPGNVTTSATATPGDVPSGNVPPNASGQSGGGASRVALLIGNSNYMDSPLRNPVNDVDAMETALRLLDFKIIKRKNTTRRELKDAIFALHEQLNEGDLGLFFYAGHGIQVKGENFLVPVGAAMNAEHEVAGECIALHSVMQAMADAEANLNVVVLDCCRNNPYQRSWTKRSTAGRGLAAVGEIPEGTLIAFATSPGTTAADGQGRNSPYTSQLVKVLGSRPPGGLELKTAFFQASRAVKNATGQIPWMNVEASLEEYYLWGQKVPAAGPREEVPQLVAVPACSGKTLEEAQRILVDAGFHPVVEVPLSHPTDIVQAMAPTAGEFLKRGSTIKLGPLTTELPDVVGQTIVAAANLLSEDGFKVDFNPQIGQSPVTHQSPEAGTAVPRGTAVQLHSLGTVPKVIGLPISDAAARLQAKGFLASGHPGSSSFTVTHQSPAAGMQIERGLPVEIRSVAEVPRVIGLSFAAASDKLREAGFQFESNFSGRQIQVTDQTPPPGTSLDRGQPVRIRAMVTAPALEGVDVSVATRSAESAGLHVVMPVNPRPGDVVARQLPPAGLRLEVGKTPLTLTPGVRIPNLIRLSEQEAGRMLDSLGLRYTVSVTEVVRSDAQGRIVNSQSVRAGEVASRIGTIRLMVTVFE